MNQKINHWKLGLLVVSSIGVAISLLAWLGAHRMQRDMSTIVCYFNESVQGLDVGSPVKMRGVLIGSVKRIGFASDKRHVEVHWDAFSDILMRLGLIGEGEELGDTPIDKDLRVQLATTGITGTKFLLVDFFEAAEEELPFDLPANYVPTAPSTLKSIEEGLKTFLSSMPRVIETVDRLGNTLADSIEQADVAGLVSDLRSAIASFEASLEALDPGKLSAEAASLSHELQATSAALREGVEHLAGESSPMDALMVTWSELAQTIDATIASAEVGPTSLALREVAGTYEGLAHEATAMGSDFTELLAQLRETLRAMRALAEYIERDPGALLRGRAASGGPPRGQK